MVTLVVVVLVLEKQLLVAEVGDEGDGGDAEAREGGPEPVPAGEGAGVAPGLAVYCVSGSSRYSTPRRPFSLSLSLSLSLFPPRQRNR